MDDIVKQAMAKWPNVPSVFGWLSLDRRGNWLLKGETIANPQINEFIARNYLHDEAGRWFFQNGPQRVFIDLAYTPTVYSVPGHPASLDMYTHTQQRVSHVRAAWIDNDGTLLLETEHGLGHVHDQALEPLLPCFVDADGRALDEDALEARFDAYAAGHVGAPAESSGGHLWFQHASTRVKIETIRARDVPARFRFVPRPEPAE
jgi:Protein of unknown function (DUF2946)